MNAQDIRAMVDSLERRTRMGALALLLGGVVIAGMWFTRSSASPARFQAIGAGTGTAASAAKATPSPSPAVLVVDVAGLVRRPGVYSFHQGDRVIDAIGRAGGAKRGADLTSINLAALLTDAEQIVIGRAAGRGGPVSSVGGSGTAGGAGSSGSGAVVNINTATLDQLETLPGIGPALAQRILDYRTQHGPFRSVQDLLNVSGIGEKRLADMKSQVTV